MEPPALVGRSGEAPGEQPFLVEAQVVEPVESLECSLDSFFFPHAQNLPGSGASSRNTCPLSPGTHRHRPARAYQTPKR